jgi:hypothetical protein
MGNISTSSQVAFLIEIFQDEQYLTSATGFLWRGTDDRFYLVSNWHVFAGKNAENPSRNLDTHGRLPNRILAYYPVQVHDNPAYLLHFREEYLLYEPSGVAKWLEHSTGSQIDVAILPLENFPNNTLGIYYKISDAVKNPVTVAQNLQIQKLYLAINQKHNIDDEYMVAGNEVFVVGYPLGGRSILPLHKHAAIATEPLIMIDNLPKILLDTGTRPGMSGSPIVSALGLTYIKKDNTGQVVNISQPTNGRLNFVGVYSGRIEEPSPAHPFEKQVGICWRQTLLAEICSTGRPYPGP